MSSDNGIEVITRAGIVHTFTRGRTWDDGVDGGLEIRGEDGEVIAAVAGGQWTIVAFCTPLSVAKAA